MGDVTCTAVYRPLIFLTITWQCAVDEQARKAVYDCGGLDTLVSLLSRRDNKKLLAAVTGAIWKCAISEYNVRRQVYMHFKDLDCDTHG